jgi:glucokinase
LDRPGATVGVDIGGTKVLGVRVSGGEVAEGLKVATPADGREIAGVLADVVARLAGPDPLSSVGIGVPGLVDSSGTLRFSPHRPALVGVPLRGMLAERLGTAPTWIGNDSTAAGWAEWRFGASRDAGDALMVTLGTGIGGGIISGGRLNAGAHGFAGEFGHMVVDPAGPRCPCGQQGCWERYASGSGLGWMAREAAHAGEAARVVELAGGDPEAVRGEHVTIAAAEGDQPAIAVMDRFAWWLALGLANLAAIFDPELIVLGGGVIEAASVLLAPVRRAFDSLLEGGAHRPRIRFAAAGLGERAGAVGAAVLARSA